MKNTGSIILLIILFSVSVFALCEDEPAIETTGRILREIKVGKALTKSANNLAEIGLFIKASVKSASWQTKGAEAAVLTIFIDGKYNQDAILFDGAEKFEYQMFLGKYNSAAEHRITIVLNKARSAPHAQNVKIYSAFSGFEQDLLETKPVDRSIPSYIAEINAPLIYLRPDTIGKFSDIPLLTYYEIFDEPQNIKRIRYTTIFTNEDGGTQSAALMARWGRMTDIEWVYEMRVSETGEVLSEIYQGANHETKKFQGARFGSHPVIFDATDNNNFADAGCSPLRVSPNLIGAALSNPSHGIEGSRETMMDAFPWTYRIMAQEAVREGRVDPQNLGVNVIDDLRNYLYVDVHSQNNSAAVAVEVQTADGKTSRSDLNDAKLRVERSGYQRIAVRLPSAAAVQSLKFHCESVSRASGSGACQDAGIVKFVKLNKNYRLTEIKNPDKNFRSVTTGEKLVWFVKNQSRYF